MEVKLGICNFCVPGTGVFAPEIVKEMGLDGMSIEFGSYEHGWPLSQRKLQDYYLKKQQELGIEYPNVGVSDGDNIPFHARPGTMRTSNIRRSVISTSATMRAKRESASAARTPTALTTRKSLSSLLTGRTSSSSLTAATTHVCQTMTSMRFSARCIPVIIPRCMSRMVS